MIRLLLWLIFGISFKHRCDDMVVSTNTFDSPWKQAHSRGTGHYSVINIGPWWFASWVITVVRCKKCGRVRHVKTVVCDPEGVSTRFTNDPEVLVKEKKDSIEDSPADSGK